MAWFEHASSLLGSFWDTICGAGRLEVVDVGPNRLLIESHRDNWIFDRRQRCVIRNGRDRLPFDQVGHIEVQYDAEDFDAGRYVDRWTVYLYRGGLKARWCIGWTKDDAQASIAAARIQEWLQVKVVAL